MYISNKNRSLSTNKCEEYNQVTTQIDKIIPLKHSINNYRFMVLNATLNNILALSWWSVLLMAKTADLPQVSDKLNHIMLYRVNLAMSVIRTHNVSDGKY